jgi:DnaK suppressor protein
MKKKDLAHFKAVLEEQLEELKGRAEGTVSQLVITNGYSADIVDRASSDIDRNTALRIRDRESKLMKKIKEALDRIEDGSYGECNMCGRDIAINRLKARPVAEYCINCKTKMESLEKASGF